MSIIPRLGSRLPAAAVAAVAVATTVIACGSRTPATAGLHHTAEEASPIHSITTRPAPFIAAFLGEWGVHAGSLCVGGRLALHLPGRGPACRGSGNAGWMGTYLACNRFPGTHAKVCYEWDELRFSPAPGGRILGTVTKVVYTAQSGATIPGFAPPDSSRVGDLFYLERVAPGLLEALDPRTYRADLKYGNPYWCGPGISTANASKCGA